MSTQMASGIKGYFARFFSFWDDDVNQNWRVIDDHLSALRAQGAPVASGTPTTAGVALLLLDGTYKISNAGAAGEITYPARKGLQASDGTNQWYNTGAGWQTQALGGVLTGSLPNPSFSAAGLADIGGAATPNAALNDVYQRNDNTNKTVGIPEVSWGVQSRATSNLSFLDLTDTAGQRRASVVHDRSSAGTNGVGSQGATVLARFDNLGAFIGSDISINSQGDAYFERGVPRYGTGDSNCEILTGASVGNPDQKHSGTYLIVPGMTGSPSSPSYVLMHQLSDSQSPASAVVQVAYLPSTGGFSTVRWTRSGNWASIGTTPWTTDQATTLLASGTANGYAFRAIQHSDGTIIQSGTTSASVSNGLVQHTMPVAFSSAASYTVVALNRAGVGFGSTRANHGAYQETAQVFRFWQDSVSAPFNYIAIGT